MKKADQPKKEGKQAQPQWSALLTGIIVLALLVGVFLFFQFRPGKAIEVVISLDGKESEALAAKEALVTQFTVTQAGKAYYFEYVEQKNLLTVKFASAKSFEAASLLHQETIPLGAEAAIFLDNDEKPDISVIYTRAGAFTLKNLLYVQPAPPANAPPVLAQIGDKTVEVGKTLTFIITATDQNNDVLTFESTTSASIALTNNNDGTATFTFTPPSEGLQTVVFKVSDGKGGEDTETITITVTAPPAPTTETICNDTIDNDKDTRIDCKDTDCAQDAACKPVEQPPTNQPPVLEQIGDKTIEIRKTLTFITKAADPNNDHLVFSATPLPSGATLTDNKDGTATFSWTPALVPSGSSVSVTFKVSDGRGGEDTETVKITVTPEPAPEGATTETICNDNLDNDKDTRIDCKDTDCAQDAACKPAEQPANNPPVLASIGDKTIEVGKTLTFIITATDVDNNFLTFTATPLPSGATFADNKDGSARFTWSPALVPSGSSVSVTFKVTDGKGGEDTETIKITVTPAPTPAEVVPTAPTPTSVPAPVPTEPTPTEPVKEIRLPVAEEAPALPHTFTGLGKEPKAFSTKGTTYHIKVKSTAGDNFARIIVLDNARDKNIIAVQAFIKGVPRKIHVDNDGTPDLEITLRSIPTTGNADVEISEYVKPAQAGGTR